jgi:hypothetical protein
MCSALAYVRFTPESDIKRDTWECLLRANSRLMQRSKKPVTFLGLSAVANGSPIE